MVGRVWQSLIVVGLIVGPSQPHVLSLRRYGIQQTAQPDLEYIDLVRNDGTCPKNPKPAALVVFGERGPEGISSIFPLGLAESLNFAVLYHAYDGHVHRFTRFQEWLTSDSEGFKFPKSVDEDCVCQALKKADGAKVEVIVIHHHQGKESCGDSPTDNLATCSIHSQGRTIIFFGPHYIEGRVRKLFLKTLFPIVTVSNVEELLNPSKLVALGEETKRIASKLKCILPLPVCYSEIPKDVRCMRTTGEACERCSDSRLRGYQKVQDEWNMTWNRADCGFEIPQFCLPCDCRAVTTTVKPKNLTTLRVSAAPIRRATKGVKKKGGLIPPEAIGAILVFVAIVIAVLATIAVVVCFYVHGKPSKEDARSKRKLRRTIHKALNEYKREKEESDGTATDEGFSALQSKEPMKSETYVNL